MSLTIETQFETRIPCSVVKDWNSTKDGPVVILYAVHSTGAKRAVAVTHTFTEADVVLTKIMETHEASGNEKVLVSARDIVMEVRRAARKAR